MFCVRTNRTGLSRQPRQNSDAGAGVPHLVKMAEMPPDHPDWLKAAGRMAGMPADHPNWLKAAGKMAGIPPPDHPDWLKSTKEMLRSSAIHEMRIKGTELGWSTDKEYR